MGLGLGLQAHVAATEISSYFLRKRAMAAGVKFGRKRKLSEYQRAEALKRRDAGETVVSIARSYAVDHSMISRLR
jgi:hypothetical protein